MRRGLAVVTMIVASLAASTWTAPAAVPAATVSNAVEVHELPLLHNLSDLSDERARSLAAEALAGLGFAPEAPERPRPNDRIVITNALIAWIDETGFYGKLNGLWWLSPTVSGDRSFSLRAADGRPVNQLVVGENGDGAWPIGNRGAEHVEVPNGTPEPHHDPACADPGQWCAVYAHDEAGAYATPLIPWWRVCDPGSLDFDDHIDPVEVTVSATSVRLVYEGRLTKTADSREPWTDATGCHEDWLFPDGVRRPVYLRVGYELHRDSPWVDRIQQIRNPPGNPPFESPFSVIGGFEITTWPAPRADKAINAFIRPEDHDAVDQWTNRTLPGGVWSTGFSEPLGLSDIVIAWMAQPFSMSTVPAWEHARSLRLSHLGPKDNLDTAFCLCLFHNSVELGGGLLHSASTSPDPAGAALPIAGGTSSIEALRRLETAPATVIADVDPWAPPGTTVTTTTATTAAPVAVVTPVFTG